MVSRDTRVQIVAGVLYFVLLGARGSVDPTDPSSLFDPINVLFSVTALFVLMAGSHLYLAVRGDGGMVPVDARWRFVVAFAVVLVVVFLGTLLVDASPIAGIEPHVPVLAAAAVLLVGYFVYEAREGYQKRKPG